MILDLVVAVIEERERQRQRDSKREEKMSIIWEGRKDVTKN